MVKSERLPEIDALRRVLVIAVLYPACLAYGRYKRSHEFPWLRYL